MKSKELVKAGREYDQSQRAELIRRARLSNRIELLVDRFNKLCDETGYPQEKIET